MDSLEPRTLLSFAQPLFPNDAYNDPSPSPPVAFGGSVWLRAGLSNPVVYRTDGTAAGTVSTASTLPLLQNASLGEDQPPVVLNDKLFAIAAPDSSLIVSDGSASGTKILASHVVANGNWATVNGNKLYFLAADTGGKYELYETDGTTAGTRSLTSSVASQGNVQSVSGFAGSWVYFMLVSGSTYKLCRTNGTTTKIITTLNTGSQPPLAGRLQPLNASQNIFAVGTSQGARLYLTDNTDAGTKPLQSTLTYTGGLTVFNSVGYFLAITDSNTIESLYRTLARRRIGRKRRTPRVNRRF